MFESEVRSKGDRGAFFEYDGETGYFYFCETKGHQSQDIKITDHMRIMVGVPDFKQKDIAVQWDDAETKVGLFIRDELWAVFDCETGAKYGGDYHLNLLPQIPADVVSVFKLRK